MSARGEESEGREGDKPGRGGESQVTHLGGKLNGEQTKEDRVWRAARRGAEVAIWYWWRLLVTGGLLKASPRT